MLKYPKCEECKFLYCLGVDDNVINDIHEDKKGISALPKVARKALKIWREKKGYAKKEDSETD